MEGFKPHDAEKAAALEEVLRLRRLICELTFEDGGCVFNSYKESVDLARMYPTLKEVHGAVRKGSA